MSFASRLAIVITTASLFAGLPAKAEEMNVEVGQSLVCDTQQQVERFVALFDGDAETAANAVNEEAKDPMACVIATIAYVRGHELETVRTSTGAYRIVRILVLGVVTDRGMEAAAPAPFYSIAEIEEERDA